MKSPDRDPLRIPLGRLAPVAGVALSLLLASGGAALRAAAADGDEPVNIAPPTISGTARDGELLTADPGAWSSSDPVTYAYQWRRCDASGATCVSISRATEVDYTLTSADVTATVRVEVTATNGSGSTAVESGATGVVQALPPASTALPSISGTAQDGQKLTAAKGTWSGSTPLTYSYQWQRCDTTGAVCTDITGATSSTRTLTSSDVGATLRVRVRADNSSLPGGGSATATSAASAVVQAVPPANTSLPIVSGTARDGRKLTASTGTWSGSTPLAYGYQWQRCNVDDGSCNGIDDATAATYSLVDDDIGSTVRVVVTASNAGGAASAVSAATGVVEPPGDPVIAAAGDIACDPADPNFNGGLGSSGDCREQYTSDVLVDDGLAAVLPLGDAQYDCGGGAAFARSYDPTWGRLMSITKPIVGNHEYEVEENGTDCDSTHKATGYFGYFGSLAGDPSRGYYSYDIGSWHIVALNSNDECKFVACTAGSEQEQWLRNDLALHPAFCTLAYWHAPRFWSGGKVSKYTAFWKDLHAAGAEIVLNGHIHNYERFAPQTPDGAADPAAGIREFVVGTGGAALQAFPSTVLRNSEVRNATTNGVLELTLHTTGYDWQFVPEAGKTFSDAGSGSCH